MPKIDIKVIKGTEQLVLNSLPKESPASVQNHPNVCVISFISSHPATHFQNLFSALSVTDQTHSLNLYKRPWRVATVAAGINPSLAYIMCQIADLKPKHTLLDPFAGAGVIPITAIKYFGVTQAIGSDISGFAIKAMQKNSLAAGTTGSLTISHQDISDLKIKPHSISAIVTNPPFGIRSGSHHRNISIYSHLANKAVTWLARSGKIVILSQEIKLVESTFSHPPFKLLQKYHLTHNGLRPAVWVYSK